MSEVEEYINISILKEGSYISNKGLGCKFFVADNFGTRLYFSDIWRFLTNKSIKMYASPTSLEDKFDSVISIKVGNYFDMKKEFEEKFLLMEIIK